MSDLDEAPQRGQTNAEKVSEVLRDVEVGGALPVRFTVMDDPEENPYGVIVRASMWVPDIRNTDSTITISSDAVFEVGRHGVLRSDVLEFCRQRTIFFYRHEAEEQLRYKGERPFIPVDEHPIGAHS